MCSRNNTPLPSEGNAQYNSIQVGGGDTSGEGAEEERLVSFLDPPLLADLAMCNIEVVPGAPPPVNNLQLLVMVYRVEWNTDKKHMNQHFSALFQSLMRSITFKVLGYLLTHVLIDSFRYRFICTRASRSDVVAHSAVFGCE